MKQYKVVGPCEILGIPPGGTVSHQALEDDGAIIAALIPFHIQPVDGAESAAEPEPKAPAKKTAAR